MEVIEERDDGRKRVVFLKAARTRLRELLASYQPLDDDGRPSVDCGRVASTCTRESANSSVAELTMHRRQRVAAATAGEAVDLLIRRRTPQDGGNVLMGCHGALT